MWESVAEGFDGGDLSRPRCHGELHARNAASADHPDSVRVPAGQVLDGNAARTAGADTVEDVVLDQGEQPQMLEIEQHGQARAATRLGRDGAEAEARCIDSRDHRGQDAHVLGVGPRLVPRWVDHPHSLVPLGKTQIAGVIVEERLLERGYG